MFKNTKNLHRVVQFLYISILLVVTVPILAGFDVANTITVKVDGQLKTVNINSTSVKKVMEAAGVELGAFDRYEISSGKKIKNGSVIEIIRAKNFTLVYQNKEIAYKTSKNTIEEALLENKVIVKGDKPKTYPESHTELEDNIIVYMVDAAEDLHVTTETIEPVVSYIPAKELAQGVEKVKEEGKAGKRIIITKQTKLSNGGVRTVELSRKIVEEAKPRVIYQGQAKSVKTTKGYKRYSKVIRVEATAYTHTGSPTSLGFMPYVGVVAVDPRIIPYRSKLYVPGYGLAIAGDTGGDIVHHRIDIFLDTEWECIQWGRRDVDVYILEE